MNLCSLANRLFGKPPLSWILPRPKVWNWKNPMQVLQERLHGGISFLDGMVPEHDVIGRAVLDVGCGMGDRTVAVALAGAASAIGLDNDLEKLSWAKALQETVDRRGTAFIHGSGSALPFPDRSFHLILLLDVIEHLDAPLAALQEIRRVLVPGGKALVTFPPFRSPWGAHLFEHVALPWAHLICGERWLLDYWRNVHMNKARRGETWLGRRRAHSMMQAETINELWSLNGMTIRRFLDLVPAASLEPVAVRLHTPGGIAAPLTRSSVFREHLVTRLSAVVERPC